MGGSKYWILHLLVPVASFVLLPSYRMSSTDKLEMYNLGNEDPWWFTLLYFVYASLYLLSIHRNNSKLYYELSSQYADAKVDSLKAINKSIGLGSMAFICIPFAMAIGHFNLNYEQAELIRKILFVLFSFSPFLFMLALINARRIVKLGISPINNSCQTESDDEVLWNKLTHYMHHEKPYLLPTLTLTDLSVQLGISRSILSRIINKRHRNNFYEFINNYRVNHFLEKLKNNEHHKSSLEGLSLECGFRSYTTFYRVFKRIHSMSPNEFINKLG